MANRLSRVRQRVTVFCASIVFVGISFAGTGTSWATDLGSGPVNSHPAGLSVEFRPYFWAPWIKGDAVVRNRPFELDVTAGDIIDALDWSKWPAWMHHLEVRYGKFTLFNDVVYANLAGSAGFAAARQGPLGAGLITLSGNVEAKYEQATIEVGAAYEILASGSTGGRQTAVDVLGGVRYWYQNLSVSGDLTGTGSLAGLQVVGTRGIAASGDVDWFDPFVGVRITHQPVHGRELTLRADIGGFGVGSDFTWHLIGAYSGHVGNFHGAKIDAYVGYKALSVDYSQGSGNSRYEFDAIYHGPVIGITAKF